MDITATKKWLRILGVFLITISPTYAFVIKRNSLLDETGMRHHLNKRQSTTTGTGGNQNDLPSTQNVGQDNPLTLQNNNVQDSGMSANRQQTSQIKTPATHNEPDNQQSLSQANLVSKGDDGDPQSSSKTTESGSQENTPKEGSNDGSYYSSILKSLRTSDYDYNNYNSINDYDSKFESQMESMGRSWYSDFVSSVDGSMAAPLQQEAKEHKPDINPDINRPYINKGTEHIGPETSDSFMDRPGLPKPSNTTRTKQSPHTSYLLHFSLLAAVFCLIFYIFLRYRRGSVKVVKIYQNEDKNPDWNQDYSAQIDSTAKEFEPILMEDENII